MKQGSRMLQYVAVTIRFVHDDDNGNFCNKGNWIHIVT